MRRLLGCWLAVAVFGCAGPSWRGARLAGAADYRMAHEAPARFRVADCRDGSGKPTVIPAVAEVVVAKQGTNLQLLTHDVGGALVFDQHHKMGEFSVFQALINGVFLEFRLPESLLGLGQLRQGRAEVENTFADGSFGVRKVDALTECTLLPVQKSAAVAVVTPPLQTGEATARK